MQTCDDHLRWRPPPSPQNRHMDPKLLAAQALIRKLAYGCSEAQLHAVSEIRLFSKWDSDNRNSLVHAGALPLLIDLLPSSEPKVQENAITALLNVSINPCNKIAIADAPGGLDAILNVLRHGLSTNSKTNAAALLNSLVLEESLRPALGSNPVLLQALLELLREGSSACKADCLKALFHIALCPPNRAELVAVGAIPLLLAFVVCGKVRLVEDSLAVLAKIAGCREGSASLLHSDTAIPVIVGILDKGSPRAQENAADALNHICEIEGEPGKYEILDCRKCVPAIKRLYFSDSERGKAKAELLMKQLSVRIPSASTVYHVREIRPEVEYGNRREPLDGLKERAAHSAMEDVRKMETDRVQRQQAADSKSATRGFWKPGNLFSTSKRRTLSLSRCFG